MLVGLGGCHSNKEEVFEHAYERGIRFYDSGFGYSGIGVNDDALGKFKATHSDIQICNKLPLFDSLYIDSFGKSLRDMNIGEIEFAIREVIKIQLERCKSDYFDVYMYHAIYDEQFNPGFDLEKWTQLYIKIYPVLAKLKEEGLIKEIGFSAHTNFERLYYFLNEMHKAYGKECMKYAMVSYNVLNDTGKPSKIADLQNVNVWPSAGLKGLKLLKDYGYFIIDMMPTESGRVFQLSKAPDWADWCYRFIRETKEIDMVLLGTSSTKHLDQGIDIFEEKDLKNIPNMRVLSSGISHCHE